MIKNIVKNILKKLLLVIFYGVYSISVHSVHAAGPVTHAFLAHYWLEKCGKHLSPAEQAEFIVGTVYPDIRYPAQLKREATHDTGVNLLMVRDSGSAFDAGKKFHAWVDDVREYFITPEYTQELFKFLSGIPSRGTFLKFIEDEVLMRVLKFAYPHVLKVFQGNMLNYYPEEQANAISQETLQDWHRLLIEHFTHSPTEIFTTLSKEHKPYGVAHADMVSTWAKELPKFSAQPLFQEHVRQLLVRFFELMTQCDSSNTYTYAKKDL